MTAEEVERLTREWILVWTEGDPRTLPLAQDFEHISPYGRIQGRDHYLDLVIPAAKENVGRLTIRDVIASADQGVVRYVMESPSGETMEACDWLWFRAGKLIRVHAYYERPRASADATLE